MPAGWAAAAAAAAGLAGSGIQASSGKKGAEANADAQLAGLGQANKTIQDALAQYGPYRAGGDQGYRQMQRFYGFRPQGGDPDAPAGLSPRQKKRAATFQKRLAAGGTLSAAEQKEMAAITSNRAARKKYAGDFNLAETVGQDEERDLLGLEKDFGAVEEGIFAQQQAAQDDYTARNLGLDTTFGQQSGALDAAFKTDVAGLDTGYASDVGALDTAFKGDTGRLDTEYGAEEKALRDKIAKGDVTIDPGYKFRLEQGQLARERGAAAKGGLLSGGHLKDLEEYSQGQASQEFGAATGRLYDLYGLGKGAYTQKRGNLEGDYERGRGFKTGDYTQARGFKTGDFERSRGNLTGDYERTRGFGRQDYGDIRSFYGQNLSQRRGQFDRRYGQGEQRRQFAIDRFGRRTGGAKGFSDQGFDALGQQTNLSQILAQLYGQGGQVQGQAAQAGYNAAGQFAGDVGSDLGFLALLYGQGAFDGDRQNDPPDPGLGHAGRPPSAQRPRQFF